MDADSQKTLFRLITNQRVAALGTLRSGGPFVSMVLFAPSPDFTAYLLHISRLAHHTQDLLKDPRASLMISETDMGMKDPQTLARVSVVGEAVAVSPEADAFSAARDAYLTRFPEAAINFALADFAIYRLEVKTARFVANFGKIFNLKPADFRHASEESA